MTKPVHQAPITPDHVYRMKDGSMRLVVSKTAGDLTYLTETDGRFVPGTEATVSGITMPARMRPLRRSRRISPIVGVKSSAR